MSKKIFEIEGTKVECSENSNPIVPYVVCSHNGTTIDYNFADSLNESDYFEINMSEGHGYTRVDVRDYIPVAVIVKMLELVGYTVTKNAR